MPTNRPPPGKRGARRSLDEPAGQARSRPGGLAALRPYVSICANRRKERPLQIKASVRVTCVGLILEALLGLAAGDDRCLGLGSAR